MLGGLDPIIIFQFSKLLPSFSAAVASSIPVVNNEPLFLPYPPIPIYLSRALTGLLIDSEDKNVEIDTDLDTLSDGDTHQVNQKGLASTVTINIRAKKDSIGLTLMSAMVDVVFDKVTSKEYSITYFHGPITIFNGVLQSFEINQNAENDMATIKVTLSRGTKTPVKPASIPVVGKVVGALPL